MPKINNRPLGPLFSSVFDRVEVRRSIATLSLALPLISCHPSEVDRSSETHPHAMAVGLDSGDDGMAPVTRRQNSSTANSLSSIISFHKPNIRPNDTLGFPFPIEVDDRPIPKVKGVKGGCVSGAATFTITVASTFESPQE